MDGVEGLGIGGGSGGAIGGGGVAGESPAASAATAAAAGNNVDRGSGPDLRGRRGNRVGLGLGLG